MNQRPPGYGPGELPTAPPRTFEEGKFRLAVPAWLAFASRAYGSPSALRAGWRAVRQCRLPTACPYGLPWCSSAPHGPCRPALRFRTLAAPHRCLPPLLMLAFKVSHLPLRATPGDPARLPLLVRRLVGSEHPVPSRVRFLRSATPMFHTCTWQATALSARSCPGIGSIGLPNEDGHVRSQPRRRLPGRALTSSPSPSASALRKALCFFGSRRMPHAAGLSGLDSEVSALRIGGLFLGGIFRASGALPCRPGEKAVYAVSRGKSIPAWHVFGDLHVFYTTPARDVCCLSAPAHVWTCNVYGRESPGAARSLWEVFRLTCYREKVIVSR